MPSTSSDLETLRKKLAAISLAGRESWSSVEAWIASATPLIRTRFSDHLDDFRTVCATPRWSSFPLFSTGGDPWSGQPPRNNFAEAAAHEGAANRRLIEEAKQKILAFLDGLTSLSGVGGSAETPSNRATTMPSTLRIFISHAGADAKFAEKLIQLIEAGLETPTGSIRCTSVAGYTLEGGDDAPEVLRENLKVCSVVLTMLTKASIASSYVLMELGAAWAFRKRAIPLIGPGATFDNLPAPFKDIHALKLDNEASMSDLITTLATETGLAETNNKAKIISALKALTETIAMGGSPGVSPRDPFRV